MIVYNFNGGFYVLEGDRSVSHIAFAAEPLATPALP
jgi:hypothetical protein